MTQPLSDAIADAMAVEMVTRYVVVAECIEPDGRSTLASITSPGLPLWAATGMLHWEASGMGAQPRWTLDEP